MNLVCQDTTFFRLWLDDSCILYVHMVLNVISLRLNMTPVILLFTFYDSSLDESWFQLVCLDRISDLLFELKWLNDEILWL